MINYNKLVNIIVFYVLTEDWKMNSIDYIKEKYDRIFLKEPNVNSFNDKSFLLDMASSVFHNEAKHTNILYMCYKFSKLMEKNLTPKDFIKVYDEFFDNYDVINNDIQINMLHVNLRIVVKDYIEKHEIFKFLFIRQKLTLDKK